MLQRENETKFVLWEILAIAFLATGGIFVKLSELSPINTGFYRVLFAFPFLFPLAYRHLHQLRAKDVITLFLAGAFLAGDVSLWNLSFSYTSVANANLLTNLTPFTVIPLAYLLFKEKIPKMFLLGAAITFIGVIVLLDGKATPAPENFFGDFLALCASFFYAGFLLIAYKLRDKYTSSVIMLVSGLGSCTTLFCTAALVEGIQVPSSPSAIWPILGLTLCLQVVGHNLLAHCQGKLSVNLSSVICLSQPAIASIYSLFIFGEHITMTEIMGILIVVGGVFLVQAQYRPKAQSREAEATPSIS